ncbi:MAG: hypothetical protein R3C56_36265 [Pirellulaceae bacterium]
MKQSEDSTLDLEERRLIYLQVRSLKRQIALANPLMQFGSMLFCKRVPTSYSHQVMQYYGWRARPGGSIFVLDKPGHSLAARDLIDGQLASVAFSNRDYPTTLAASSFRMSTAPSRTMTRTCSPTMSMKASITSTK